MVLTDIASPPRAVVGIVNVTHNGLVF
jgi:hypothetical protein